MKNSSVKRAATESSAKSKALLSVKGLFIQLFFFLTFCTLALIIDFNIEKSYLFSLPSLAASGLLAGFYIGRKTKKKGLLNGIIFMLPSALLFILISSLLNDFNVDSRLLLTLLVFIISCGSGGAAATNLHFGNKAAKRVKRHVR